MEIVTYIPEEEQATIALLESLEGNGKAEKGVSELTTADFNTDNGMTLLIQKLEAPVNCNVLVRSLSSKLT